MTESVNIIPKKTFPIISESNVDKFVEKLNSDADFQSTFSAFVSTLDEQKTKPKTAPSIVTVGGSEEIGLIRLYPEDIEKYLWMHPVIPRGIEIKANRMVVKKEYEIFPFDDSQEAKEAAKDMERLLENSGGPYKIKKWAEDAYGFGNGYVTLVPNTSETEIVKIVQEHPIYFRIARKKLEDSKIVDSTSGTFTDIEPEFSGDMKIDPKTRRASSFTQVAKKNHNEKFIPIGKEIPADFVAHLTFDTWGDEVEGISLIQYVFLVIKYLLNIENAGAETLYRAGFTQKKVTTEITTEKDLKRLGRNLSQINSKDAIILPKGTDVVNLTPGNTEFAKYHDVFITLLAIRLGVPKPHLTLDGTSTNKATVVSQTSFVVDDFKADELRIKQVIEDQVFKSALQYKHGEDFIKIPRFMFKEIPEDKSARAERMLRLSLVTRNFTDSYKSLTELNKQKEAETLLEFLLNDVIKKEQS